MGWQGNFMFLDIKEVVDTISKNKEEYERVFIRNPIVYKNKTLVSLEEIGDTFKNLKNMELSAPGDHNSYAVHIYKSGGRAFFFNLLPYFCYKNKMPLYKLLRKMLPDKDFFRKMWKDGKIAKIDKKYLFEFEIEGKKYSICDLLLKYPDWIKFKEGLKEVVERKEEFKEFIITDNVILNEEMLEGYVGKREYFIHCLDHNWLENLFNIIKEGKTEEENTDKILCLVSGEAPSPVVPKFKKIKLRHSNHYE